MRFYLIAAAMLVALSAPAAADPIATTDGDIPGQRIEVTELKRGSGDTLTLKLTVINESKQDIGTNTFYDPKVGGDYYTAGGISLVDAANKKKYLVIRDAEGTCLCSRDLAEIKAGASSNIWAKFPAPPAEVDKITVVVPHFIPMDDVPISP